MSRFRLAAIDVDGTLTDPDDRLRPAVREAVRAVLRAGGRVVLATGRGPVAGGQTIAQLGFDLPLVLANGALLHDRLGEPPWRRRLLPPAVARQVVRLHRAAGMEPLVYDDPAATGQVLLERAAPSNAPFAERHPQRLLWEPDLLAALDRDVLLTTCLGEERPIRALSEDLAAALDGQATVQPLYHPKYQCWSVDVLAPGCCKWLGVLACAERWGIAGDEVLAIGDGLNDLPLLQGAGWGVAMGNAAPEVQAAADEVVPDNAHDGVAVALRRHWPAAFEPWPVWRLVALDADGTLFDSTGRITPAVRSAVAATQALGVEVVVATAREAVGASHITQALGFAVGAVMVNGALVAPTPLARPWHRRRLARKIARAAVLVGQRPGLAVSVWHDPRRRPCVEVPAPWRHQPRFVREQRRRVRVSRNLAGRLRHDPLVVAINGPPVQIGRLATTLQRLLGRRAEVLHAPYPPDRSRVINVFARGCNKWSGIQAYARHRGLRDDAVLAIGDGENDVPMLQAAGLGVAMGNATPAARAAADVVVADCDHDGVAEALRRYLLEPAAALEGEPA
ncbi:MAG: HAD hydrolase family protein [Fimbriimonadaceae bacterium]|nr:HAD hydrolase family protein [Fimbriimonadaceae bacterium]